MSRDETKGVYCTACGEMKPWGDFSKSKTGCRGHTPNCKPCRNAKHREWRTENPDLAKELSQAWIAKNKEYVLERARKNSAAKRQELGPEEYNRLQIAYREANPEKTATRTKNYYAKNKDKFREVNRLDRLNRPEAHAAYDANKRAKRKNGYCPWADQDAIKAIYERAKSLTELTGIMHHVDHIVPLSNDLVQGFHVETNLRITYWRDNILKSNKFDPDTFDPYDIPALHNAHVKEGIVLTAELDRLLGRSMFLDHIVRLRDFSSNKPKPVQ